MLIKYILLSQSYTKVDLSNKNSNHQMYFKILFIIFFLYMVFNTFNFYIIKNDNQMQNVLSKNSTQKCDTNLCHIKEFQTYVTS